VGTFDLVVVAIFVVGLLVGLAYVIGRGVWRVAEPGDDDPGGQESPVKYLSGQTDVPFVEYLRLAKRLRNKETGAQRKIKR
jgi:hypothetical protein